MQQSARSGDQRLAACADLLTHFDMKTDAVVYDMVTSLQRAGIIMRKLKVRRHAKLGFSYEIQDLGIEFTPKFAHRVEVAAARAGIRVDGDVVGGGDAVRLIVRRALSRA